MNKFNIFCYVICIVIIMLSGCKSIPKDEKTDGYLMTDAIIMNIDHECDTYKAEPHYANVKSKIPDTKGLSVFKTLQKGNVIRYAVGNFRGADIANTEIGMCFADTGKLQRSITEINLTEKAHGEDNRQMDAIIIRHIDDRGEMVKMVGKKKIINRLSQKLLSQASYHASGEYVFQIYDDEIRDYDIEPFKSVESLKDSLK